MAEEVQRRIKVLIVDDNPDALARIEQMLREEPLAQAWDVRYASNGHGALAELEYHGSADVVVTKMQMPLMDGTTLLTSIRTQYPSTVRIISATPETLSSAMNSVSIAHQFLSSPIDATQLTVAIERTIEVQQRIVNAPMRASLGSIDVLPSPPMSVVELNRALARPDASIEEISGVIERDPAMTAKLLQLVNSSFFGISHRVQNVRQATSMLGLQSVRNLLIAVEMVRAFVPSDPELTQSAEEIYQHSLAIAEMARAIMGHHKQANDAFAAGMMHDIGFLAIMHRHPARYLELRDAVQHGTPMDECEVAILGAKHADIGAYVLGTWGLPHTLVESVARSHDADQMADRVLSPVHAVFIAEQITNVSGREGASWENGIVPDHDYLVELGVADVVANIVGHVSH